MYEIRSAGPKGLGVFAKSLIPRGTRIFSERPLLSLRPDQSSSDIYTVSRLLPPKHRASLLSLSSHITSELRFLRWNQALWYTLKALLKNFPYLLPRYCHFEPQRPGAFSTRNSLREHVDVLSIFRSNSFNVNSEGIYQAVFEGISRINHACVPNSQGNWSEGSGRFNVHATRDIAKDEEVSLSYLSDFAALREARVEKLRSGYGFDCGCPACDLGSESGRIGEEKRVGVRTLLGNYAESVKGGGDIDPNRELDTMMQFIKMLEGEAITGREVASMYLEVAELNEGLGRREEALRCAERAEEIDRACLGTDHEGYETTRKFVDRLRGETGKTYEL
ncbi:uncharacterized protein PAC_09633 [Phialocephala subalpina]|uniref:SET domain-containing protein n=1 Tax=Phialocephala subalpina TaxID=576137 RepID=A0A1L7X3Y6_9HELO|nr:uncharacterized protein PAC_09633 [Phialocephala subalpina]